MTHKREKILKGILNNLHRSFFSYSALLMMVDYIRDKSEAKITLKLFTKKISGVKNIVPENLKTINYYIDWLKKECQKRKVPFDEISEVTLTLKKRTVKILYIIPMGKYEYKTIIKTNNKKFKKNSFSQGWI